eukprot:Nk52_evm7s228 gene=Nk52_evmTU7s228
MSNLKVKLQRMRENQQKWKEEHEREKINGAYHQAKSAYTSQKKEDNAVDEYYNFDDAERKASGSASLESETEKNHDELSELAKKIAKTLKAEFREEIFSQSGGKFLGVNPGDEREDQNMQAPAANSGNENMANTMKKFLATELAQHTCNLCFEIMCPPAHSPMLLVPCGHTICQRCLGEKILQGSSEGVKYTCLECQHPVTSYTRNVALQQVISHYSANNYSLNQPSRQAQIKKYLNEYGNCLTRCECLKIEYDSIKKTVYAPHLGREDLAATLHNLQAEEQSVLNAIQQLQQRLEGIRQQKKQCQEQMNSSEEQQKHAHQKLDMIKKTLSRILQERDKIKLILDNLNIPGDEKIRLPPDNNNYDAILRDMV